MTLYKTDRVRVRAYEGGFSGLHGVVAEVHGGNGQQLSYGVLLDGYELPLWFAASEIEPEPVSEAS